MRNNYLGLGVTALLAALSPGWHAHAAEAVRIEAPRGLLANGDFERPAPAFAWTDKMQDWGLFLHGKSDARVSVENGQGRGGSRGARYSRTTAGSDNAHLDQIVAVEPDATYEVAVWVRAEGRLNPVLAVMTLDWKPLAAVASNAGTNWTRVTFLFNSADHDRVRFEWFPGAQGKPYQGFAGTSWLDEVTVTRLKQVPPALQRALALVRAPRRDEIDLAAVRTGMIGQPAPLRPISCRNGALVYADGSEVALWGVNLQTALNWEYECRMKPCGIPLEAAALKQIADRNLDELVRLNAGVIRMHLLPSDFSDAEGNLRDSVFLDVLDYTIAGCRARGLYVYLTLMNTMGHFYFKDSFMAGRDHRDWIVDPALVDQSARYIRALLERENRYTKTPYKTEPAVAIFEIANEPDYVDYLALTSEPRYAPLRRTFAQWCAAQGCTNSPDLQYLAFRHDQVRAYLDRMCTVIRSTGSPKPIAWNLNWPQMVAGHEDVFQAVAESAVDVVSFCLYPGQADVQEPLLEPPGGLERTQLPAVSGQALCRLRAAALGAGKTVRRQGQGGLRVRDVLQPVQLPLPGHGAAVPRARRADRADVDLLADPDGRVSQRLAPPEPLLHAAEGRELHHRRRTVRPHAALCSVRSARRRQPHLWPVRGVLHQQRQSPPDRGCLHAVAGDHLGTLPNKSHSSPHRGLRQLTAGDL